MSVLIWQRNFGHCSAYHLQPISAKTLDISNIHICWNISKKKKNGEVLDHLSDLMEVI